MCGENAPLTGAQSLFAGSSPRVRGKPATSHWPFIPPGSSPRVRGKPLPAIERILSSGLIPACAGKTGCSTTYSIAARAHPRVCGENRTIRTVRLTSDGSSPRVRGKPLAASPLDCVRGLIPACAGKTNAARFQSRAGRAHPRVCGENTRRSAHQTVKGGSSPRVRGKPSCTLTVAGQRGLIPACAGKTSRLAVLLGCLGAHPRVCGENKGVAVLGKGMKGSSPRVRGKRTLFAFFWFVCGLIPACAGKTIRWTVWSR